MTDAVTNFQVQYGGYSGRLNAETTLVGLTHILVDVIGTTIEYLAYSLPSITLKTSLQQFGKQ